MVAETKLEAATAVKKQASARKSRQAKTAIAASDSDAAAVAKPKASRVRKGTQKPTAVAPFVEADSDVILASADATFKTVAEFLGTEGEAKAKSSKAQKSNSKDATEGSDAAKDTATETVARLAGSASANGSVSVEREARARILGEETAKSTKAASAAKVASTASAESPTPSLERIARGQKLFKLEAPFAPAGDQGEAITKIVSGIKSGYSSQTLLGVTGSGKTFTMANVIAEINRPTMILSHNKTLAAQLYGEMKEFFPHNAVEYFVSYYDYYQPEAYIAATDTYIEKDASVNEQIDQMRLSATKALMERRDTIVVCSVSAIYGLGEPETYLQMMLHLSKGDQITPQQITNRLAYLQYSRNDVAFERATFRVHGDVIDIFPAESDSFAIRVELFDDEIERISSFDPLTGHVECELPRFTVFPKSHYVTPREILLHAVDQIKVDLKDQCAFFLANNKLLEEQRLRERTRYDIEMINEVGYCSGIENYSRYLTGRAPGEPPPCLFDYLPKDGLLIIDESHVTVPQIGAMFKGDHSRKENLIKFGFRLPSAADNRPLKFEEFEHLRPQTLYVSATPADYELQQSSQVVEQLIRPTGLLDPRIEVRPVATQVDDLMSEIRARAARHERTLVTTLTKKMAEELAVYYAEHGLRVRYMHADIDAVERMDIIRDLRLEKFDALIGINLLREGLDIPEVSLVAILDADKEGFLRSARSLIQTVGRAARNVNGMAIFYADKMTKSMKQTIDETNRRREIQERFNKEHGITPTQIKKKVLDVVEMALKQSEVFKPPVEVREMPPVTRAQWEAEQGVDTVKGGRRKQGSNSAAGELKALLAENEAKTQAAAAAHAANAANTTTGVASTAASDAAAEVSFSSLPDAHDVTKQINELQKQMVALARELRFEEAAVLRDRMQKLKQLLLMLPSHS